MTHIATIEAHMSIYLKLASEIAMCAISYSHESTTKQQTMEVPQTDSVIFLKHVFDLLEERFWENLKHYQLQ